VDGESKAGKRAHGRQESSVTHTHTGQTSLIIRPELGALASAVPDHMIPRLSISPSAGSERHFAVYTLSIFCLTLQQKPLMFATHLCV